MNNLVLANIFYKIGYYLQFDFVIYAIIVVVLIALCASLLGVNLVLKRLSFISDGLSHVAFGAMAVATAMSLSNNMLIVMPITIICAVILVLTNNSGKIKGDSAVAMISVGAMAIGYLIQNIFGTSSSNVSADVCTTLFGSTSILTLSTFDVWLSIILSVIVIAFFIIFYNKIFAVTFDEEFAKSSGTKVKLYNIILAIIIAVVIVLAMKLVGTLLISALIIFPTLSCMRLFNNFKKVMIASSIFSVVLTLIGMFIAILAGTPIGATLVATQIVGFIICFGVGKILKIS